jgi:hypothetical protein
MGYVVLHRHAVYGYATISLLDMVLVYTGSKGVEPDNRGPLLGPKCRHLLRHFQRSLVCGGRFCAGAHAMVSDLGAADEGAGEDWSRNCHEHGSLVRIECCTHLRNVLT